MRVYVFEDEKAENFLPLTYTRAVFDLRVGVKTLLERFEELTESEVIVGVRDLLADLYKHKYNRVVNEVVTEETLFVNGRLLLDSETRKVIEKITSEKNFVALSGTDLVVAKFDPAKSEEVSKIIASKPITEAEVAEIKKKAEKVIDLTGKVTILNYPWDIIKVNAKQIAEDYERYFSGGAWEADEVGEHVVIKGDKSKVYITKGVVIEEFVYIDTRTGPVYIGENTKVQAGARIEGPTYIGKDTIIVGGAQIREGSNIGDVCRVGGEFEESVMHGYSNKYHYGFIGHAYVGEWVNLGAGTTNSDLKDTYGTVRVTIKGKRIDTGMKKVGCFIGDMVKTSLGVCIYTGKRIGVASHLHGVVFEDVPSFTIYAKSLGAEPTELYLESAIEIQRRMMARRKKTLSKVEEELIRKLFEITAKEREKAGVKKGKFKF